MKASNRVSPLVLVVLAAALAACGDDTAAGGSAPGGGGTGGTPPVGGNNEGGGGAPAEGGGGAGQGGGTAGGPACAGLVPGPIAPVEVTDLFNGSEDFAFDGAGNIVGKDGGDIISIDAADVTTVIAPLTGQSYGLRYGSSGSLFVAQPMQGKIVEVSGGVVTDFITGLAGPNGVYADFDGNLWVTEFGGGKVIKVDSTGAETTIVDGQNSPNGVVLDVARDLLFYTSYSNGRVFHVDPAGATEPVEVADINGSLDGLVLDACGNVYVVDQENSDLYRLNLDANAALVGEPELIASLPQNVANAQFGSGAGWNTTSLYVTGNPGVVYELAVGVAGAPVPTR